MEKIQYMVAIDLPELSEELLSIVPAQRDAIDKLFKDKTITYYSVSVEKLKLWIVVNAASKYEVMDLVSDLPVYPHIVHSDVAELMFQNSATFLPSFSLN